MYVLQKIKGKSLKNHTHHNSKILNSVKEKLRYYWILLKFHRQFTEVCFLHASVNKVAADKSGDKQENKILSLKSCKAKSFPWK